MLVSVIELTRKVKRWWGQCLMALELMLSWLILIGSILSAISLPFIEVSLSMIVSVICFLVMGVLQWRWRAAIWPAIKKHKLSLEKTDLSA